MVATLFPQVALIYCYHPSFKNVACFQEELTSRRLVEIGRNL